MFENDKADLQQKISQVKEHKKKLEVIIRPFLSDNLGKKQVTELCHVGKFIMSLSENAHIVKHADSPDFVISHNGELIGLEHEQVLIADKVEKYRSLRKLFDDAANDFEVQYPEYKLLANCRLVDENYSFAKKDSIQLRRSICEYIYGLVTEQPIDKPSFIEEVRIMKHSQVAFCYNGGAHYVSELDSPTLNRAIAKKDALIESYKMNSDLKEQWLLIVTGGASKDSFEVNENKLENNIRSKFHRVYLLDDFSAKILRIV
ncbi:hypothetical protein CJD36_016740 [Flavipsychrobacter stenotrophus]|uniref:Uncharacterized protein n=1 Tax=Flavipsychrobacter stenotrophus TaxID=2077091 RepID=A0A2S7SST0_9BACT|nr:hypothetical protein [Flavipsychrobacter stenotrophus]PQJ09586.1 hypothetical protein CJD36_016740 [Flavipsychrobacter stenotrophus]